MFKVLTPYPPEETIRKMADMLRQTNAKTESMTNRSLKATIKIGLMSNISISANVTETPFGSTVEFTIPDAMEEQLVDSVFFGDKTARISQNQRVERIVAKINELKTSIDALDEEEARHLFGYDAKLKFLDKCRNCGSNNRKGFRCAYCNSLMVELE
jgi:hypothetical protein